MSMRVLSLFCGCGGMDLGLMGSFEYLGKEYPRLDYDIIKAIDNDPYCTKIYNQNFGHQCEVMDVRDLDIHDLPDFDVLIGGFPCQSFSISAQNPPRLGYKDERGMLFFEMVKILKKKQPRFLIAENVKGLLSANGGKAFPMILQEFGKAGYHIKFKLFNASEFGVPQKRERVLIIGFREVEDYKNFNFPMPTTPYDKVPLGLVINSKDNKNEKLFFSEKAVEGMMRVRDKMNKGRIQSLDQPCNTISSHMAKVSLNSTDPVLFINGRYRRFSSQECARIQSFPENFKWDSVSESKQLKAIGNAVPPVLMWHIAEAVQKSTQHKKAEEKCEDEAPYLSREWPSEAYVQLSLFEPDTVYLSSKDKNYVLIGPCRQGIINWIKESLKYCYPVTDNDLLVYPQLLNVKEIIIRHKDKQIGHYGVSQAEVVVKAELNAYEYPTKSSRHKADTKYILYSLTASISEEEGVDFNLFVPILGKGLK
ncbi:MAG: DNA (cytosine-5-)-methyltransferase [Bacteroidales bacterium]|nr:DNA (cytosine-5-)-methyltransferase [Bacteroidales bacterium]